MESSSDFYVRSAYEINNNLDLATNVINNVCHNYVKTSFNELFGNYFKDSFTARVCDCYALLEDNLSYINKDMSSLKSLIMSRAEELDFNENNKNEINDSTMFKI